MANFSSNRLNSTPIVRSRGTPSRGHETRSRNPESKPESCLEMENTYSIGYRISFEQIIICQFGVQDTEIEASAIVRNDGGGLFKWVQKMRDAGPFVGETIFVRKLWTRKNHRWSFEIRRLLQKEITVRCASLCFILIPLFFWKIRANLPRMHIRRNSDRDRFFWFAVFQQYAFRLHPLYGIGEQRSRHRDKRELNDARHFWGCIAYFGISNTSSSYRSEWSSPRYDV